MRTYEDSLSAHGPSTPLAASMLVIAAQFQDVYIHIFCAMQFVTQICCIAASSPKAVYCEALDVLSAETFLKDVMLANWLILNRQVSCCCPWSPLCCISHVCVFLFPRMLSPTLLIILSFHMMMQVLRSMVRMYCRNKQWKEGRKFMIGASQKVNSNDKIEKSTKYHYYEILLSRITNLY